MTTVTEAPDLWLGTSWKMTKTIAESCSYIDDLAGADLPDGLRLFALPSHTALASVRDRLGPNSRVMLGAQNAHPGPEGAPTGEVSMRMVRDAGASIVEIGHAERRARFGDTEELVAAKVVAAVEAGLIPLVCAGESRAVRGRGDAAAEVVRQVRSALDGVAGTNGDVLVAYEPHWAIGSSGEAAVPAEIADVIAEVRAALSDLLPTARTHVLYGGSVDLGNVRDLITHVSIDGLFVGRAAWTARGFIDLAHACSAARDAQIAKPLVRSHRKEW